MLSPILSLEEEHAVTCGYEILFSDRSPKISALEVFLEIQDHLGLSEWGLCLSLWRIPPFCFSRLVCTSSYRLVVPKCYQADKPRWLKIAFTEFIWGLWGMKIPAQHVHNSIFRLYVVENPGTWICTIVTSCSSAINVKEGFDYQGRDHGRATVMIFRTLPRQSLPSFL